MMKTGARNYQNRDAHIFTMICTLGFASLVMTLGVIDSHAAIVTAGVGAAIISESDDGPGTSAQQGIALAPNVTSSMCTPEFWISRTRNASQVLLTREQIEQLNSNIVLKPEAMVDDLSALPEVFNGRELVDKMANFVSPTKLYLNGVPVPESYYQAIRDNISSSAVSSEMPLRYGFVVNHTVMKGYPYADFLSDSATDPEWDNLASAGATVNEPLAIYYFTGDGKFAYVKASYCGGWVPTEDIAVCRDKAEWEAARKMDQYLVVTGEKVYLETSGITAQASEKMLAMGTVLERVPVNTDNQGTQAVDMISGRKTWNNYVVKLPCRAADGSFYQELALVPANRDVSTRYLTFTTEHVIQQAFKSLGNRYGWGGMMKGQDCSSFVRDVYRCFGLVLPRNTTWQGAMPVDIIAMSDMSDAERATTMSNLLPGTILQFPGHEILYLGSVNGKYYTINDVSSLVSPYDTSDPHTVLRIRSVIVNDLSTMRRSGKTWMQELTKAIQVSKPKG